MKHIKLIKIVVLLFALVIFKFEAEANELQFQTITFQDGIVLKKNNSERRKVIQSGEKIKLWLSSKYSEVGILKALHHDTLILLQYGMERKFLVNDIEKIKVYAGSFGRTLGGMFIVVGVGGMVFGGISLIAGTIALIADNIGAIVLVAVPVLAGGGFGVFKVGQRLSGNKLNLKSKWSIEINQK